MKNCLHSNIQKFTWSSSWELNNLRIPSVAGKILRSPGFPPRDVQVLCNPLPLTMGRTCEQDSSPVIRLTIHQLLIKKEFMPSRPDLIKGAFRRWQNVREACSSWPCWCSVHASYSCKELNSANSQGKQNPETQMRPQPRLIPWVQPGETLKKGPH